MWEGCECWDGGEDGEYARLKTKWAYAIPHAIKFFLQYNEGLL